MITVDGKEIKKDGRLVIFPIDGAGQPSAMLSGYDDTETLRVVRVNNAGELKVNAAVTVGDITIGDVGLIADDAVGASGSINRIQNADLTSSLLVRDTRMNFNTTELKTLAYGNNAGADVALSVDGTGKMNVNISSVGTVTVTSQDAMYVGMPTATTDILSDILSMDVRHFLNKTAVVKNTGANGAAITITASVDGGVTYPIPLASGLEVPAGTTYVYSHNTAITNLKIQMKSYVVGNHTTVGVTAYAMGA